MNEKQTWGGQKKKSLVEIRHQAKEQAYPTNFRPGDLQIPENIFSLSQMKR